MPPRKSGWGFKVPKRIVGFAMLGGTILLWTGSSVALQSIFENPAEGHFEQPVFVTLFNSAIGSTMLLPMASRACLSTSGTKSAKDVDEEEDDYASLLGVVPLSATVGVLWLCSQCIFNWSLLYTSVATSTVLSSTSTLFTFIFSIAICRDPFRILSFCGALASCAGCTLVALQSPKTLDEDAVNNSGLGNLLTLVAAALFALVSVMLRRHAPPGQAMEHFMGMNGLLSVIASPALLFFAHTSGIEIFRAPSLRTLWMLALNALLGSTFANYLYTSAMMILSPLMANVGMSLSIPVSALVDELLLQQHRFSAGWLCGAGIVASGVIVAAFDLQESENGSSGKEASYEITHARHRAEVRKAQEHELEALLEAQFEQFDVEEPAGDKKGG